MIVQMKRLTLVAHKGDEQAILKALQPLSSVEVIRSENAAVDTPELAEAEARVQQLGDALATIRPYGDQPGLLTPKPEATVSGIRKNLPDALAHSAEIEQFQRDLLRIRSEIEKNTALIDSLRPWENFPADMQTYKNVKSVRFFPGIIAANDVEKLASLEADVEYQLYSEGANRAAIVACAEEDAKSVAGYLKSLNWADFAFPKLSGTPRAAIASLESDNKRLEDEREATQKKLVEKAMLREEIAGAYDAAAIERDRIQAVADMAETAATFELEGWLRSDMTEETEKAVRSVTDAYYLAVRDPEEDEVPPSVVKNNSFNEPFEQVTNLYSRPEPKGLDATPYMAPFYVLLFGLMLSDTGYGIVLAIGCWLYLKLKKPTGMSGGIVRVLFWGGLSTVVWGVLVGTFFGMDFDTVFGTTNVFPIILDPMDNPIGMLILCFGLGILHILFGVGLKMKMSFAQGDWQTAIFDNFSWILIILGLIVYVLPQVVTAIPAAVGTAGVIAAMLGAVMILLFKGRQKKNVFSRTISGLGELYQITGYLSDILSYARLFALGIATGVIASVFNDLCGMLMSSPNIVLKILGIVVACALLVALHLFNIAINTLGAFVHCARLQYVEFYGKFYEMGGRTFHPLAYNTKHVSITQQ